jgi:large subunit ribosomal protein L22
MEVRAHLKHARMAPRKIRLVREAVIGLPVREARSQLIWQRSKAADILLHVLNSAAANAQHNFELAEENLLLADLVVNDGITFKRFQPASRGSAHPFRKRTSQVTVVLREIKPEHKKHRAKKSEIDTVTVDEFTKRQAAEKIEEETASSKAQGRAAGDASPVEEAYAKKKIQQRGSGAKTYRRKSI